MNDNFICGGEERAGRSRAFCVPELLFNFRTKKKLAEVGSHHYVTMVVVRGADDFMKAEIAGLPKRVAC